MARFSLWVLLYIRVGLKDNMNLYRVMYTPDNRDYWLSCYFSSYSLFVICVRDSLILRCAVCSLWKRFKPLNICSDSKSEDLFCCCLISSSESFVTGSASTSDSACHLQLYKLASHDIHCFANGISSLRERIMVFEINKDMFMMSDIFTWVAGNLICPLRVDKFRHFWPWAKSKGLKASRGRLVLFC